MAEIEITEDFILQAIVGSIEENVQDRVERELDKVDPDGDVDDTPEITGYGPANESPQGWLTGSDTSAYIAFSDGAEYLVTVKKVSR